MKEHVLAVSNAVAFSTRLVLGIIPQRLMRVNAAISGVCSVLWGSIPAYLGSLINGA